MQRSGPVVGTAAGFHGNQRLLAVCKERCDLLALELVALNLAGFGIHKVELKHVLGDIHSDNGLSCGRLHGGASSHEVVATNFHFGTLMPLLRGPNLCKGGVSGVQRRCR